MESAFSCEGWSMHQPVDWDCTDLLTDMFVPLSGLNIVSEQQQLQQPQPQPQLQPHQQMAMVTLTSMAPPSTTAYTNFHGMWESSMHQPVDWQVSALMSSPAPAVAQASTQPCSVPSAALQQQQQQSLLASAPSYHHHVLVPSTSSVRTSVTATATASQPQKEVGMSGGGNSGTKRDRGGRRTNFKSNPLRPQQQQMIDLQKRLDALMAEHTVVEAENARLKTRLRVLEAVLPVRQQQARWAQSRKEIEERTAAAPPPPDPPVLAPLLELELAASGPSSCATSSPPRMEDAANPGTAAGGLCCSVEAGLDAIAAEHLPEGSSPGMGVGPDPADGPAPCASSSAATPTPTTSTTATATTTTTNATSGNTNANQAACRNVRNRHNGHNGLSARSWSLNTTRAPGCGRQHPHHHDHHRQHHHRADHHQSTSSPSHSTHCYQPLRNECHERGCHGHGMAVGAGGGSGCSRDGAANPQSESHARWLEAWRAWVREAALLLQAHDARPNEHYLNRLEEAFTKLKSEVVYLGLSHPELICNMRCVNLETGAEQEFPPDSFWSIVVSGMKLDAQQVADCKSALALYRERMAVVLSERRSLAAQLSTCLTALQLEEADGRAAPGSMRREQLTLEAEEAAVALDSNVAVEGHTTSLARDLLGSNLFSRLQCARASVLSYPYFPDALAIISAAVADPPPPPPPQQQQQQHETTRSGSAEGAQRQMP